MNKIIRFLLTIAVSSALFACSSTSEVPEGDRLYTGLEPIKYTDYESNEHFTATQEEIEAALDCPPNGAIFGSSYYRSPFPYSLWIWNAFHESESPIGKWVTKTFGNQPVLMSWVNPALRASVAQSQLRNHGYFRGTVSYEEKPYSKHPKAKIAYHVDCGHLFTIDTVTYSNFPLNADSLIAASADEAKIKSGSPFDVVSLDAERNRLSNLFRNNGYYYYQPSYASYRADTVNTPGKVKLDVELADNLPEKALKKWYIGNISINLRRTFMEELKDSIHYYFFRAYFNGKKPPVRPRVIMSDMKLRHGQPYDYSKHTESNNRIASKGMFSSVDFQFTPRDTTTACDTLDLLLNCVFDKPYDFYVETNYKGKTTGRMGPAMTIGFTKRNAFRGGEKLDINLNGSYEWQMGHSMSGSADDAHSYQYGADASLEFPRLLVPFLKRRRYNVTPSTLLKASSNVINRAGFFKRHVVSGELTYTFQPSATSMHVFSPLTLQYDYMSSHSAKFDSVLNTSAYLQVSMKDQFVPKMKYTYMYTSPEKYRNPIFWQMSISEAGNILSAGYLAFGHKWNSKDKKMFKNPYAQFFKIETDWRKKWSINDHDQFVAHAAAGIIWSYGNSSAAPYNEQLYVGGANSIRAFTMRTVGPGGYMPTEATTSYLDQTGDMKLLFNLEYRPRLFGNLYGAVFLDAGNVWSLKDNDYRPESKFEFKNMFSQMAMGTGVGLRYDLDFFVIRVDWGIGLHLPYKSGFYNVPSFKKSQTLHLAIGYPF